MDELFKVIPIYEDEFKNLYSKIDNIGIDVKTKTISQVDDICLEKFIPIEVSLKDLSFRIDFLNEFFLNNYRDMNDDYGKRLQEMSTFLQLDIIDLSTALEDIKCNIIAIEYRILEQIKEVTQQQKILETSNFMTVCDLDSNVNLEKIFNKITELENEIIELKKPKIEVNENLEIKEIKETKKGFFRRLFHK